MSLWQIWWIALAVKTILLPIIPVTPDEAYYFVWARHPALSYFDHPPFIAWIMTMAIPLWKTSLGIRLPGVIFGHLGYIPWIGILSKLKFSHRAKVIWILGLMLGPLTGLGGFVITPDVPLVFFWSLGLWILLTISEDSTTTKWLLLGIVVGLGLLSKYMMVLFIPATFIWLWWEGRLSELKKPGPWLCTVMAVLVFLPVLIWNYKNDFASFLFQSRHGLSDNSGFKWNYPLEYLSSQLGLLNPIFAVAGIYATYKYFNRQKLLVAFSLTPFIFFLITSLRARVEANWPVCAYPAFIALGTLLTDDPQLGSKWFKWIKSGLYVSLVFLLLVISHTVHPWLPISKDKDHTEITREWLIDIPAVRGYSPLYARSYQMAAFHSYFRPPDREVFKLAGFNRVDVYDFISESTPTQKAYIILKHDDVLPQALQNKFELRNPISLPSHLFVYEIIPK